LPPGAELLAEGTAGQVASWAKAYSDELSRFGKNSDGLLSEFRGQEQKMRDLARHFIENWATGTRTKEAA